MSELFELEHSFAKECRAFLESLDPDKPIEQFRFKQILKNYERLLKQSERMVKISDRITGGLNSYKDELLEKVNIDPLTNVYNRNFLQLMGERYIKSMNRSVFPLGVIIFDIDFFKNYNDTYGHAQGDVCLKAVAGALKSTVKRADDFVVRYGGEEFLIVMPNTDKNGAMIIANQALQNVRNLQITHEKSLTAPYVTVSVGVTCAIPTSEHSIKNFVTAADEGLYRSKANGKNQVTFVEMEV